MSDMGIESLRRPLTKHERDLLAWLIDYSSFQDPDQLRVQVDHLSVYQRCTCGCPTIYFAYDGVPVDRQGEGIVSDHAATVEGDEVDVMLFERRGKLSSLEVYSCAGHTAPFGLPRLEDLRVLPS